ncbi:hypothetical protein BJ912DRAFT_1109650 [Pholiota molesta]|nr:hypothetical protein BJ912DRAFT_1109650 [Pholiota molesta]
MDSLNHENGSHKHQSRPSERLRDADNGSEIELRSHQEARRIAAVTAAKAQAHSTTVTNKKKSHPLTADTSAAAANSGPSLSNPTATPSASTLPASSSIQEPASQTASTASKRTAPLAIDVDDDDGNNPRSKQPRAHVIASPTPPEILELDVSEPETPKISLKDRSQDIDAFFEAVVKIDGKSRRQCIICKKKGGGTLKPIVADPSTLRRHLEAFHMSTYNKWCEQNTFLSKLPGAVKARKDEEKARDRKQQASLDPHLREPVPTMPVALYSHELFQRVAVEWLVSTNQPLSAMNDTKFREMIQLAARVPNGVIIPERKSNRKYIIDLFTKNIEVLRNRLAVSDKVGAINLTCDAWQASNTDAYFAVTGH